MKPQSFKIVSEDIRRRAIVVLQQMPLDPVCEVVIKEYKKNRNLEQNKKLWAMLSDISDQVLWHNNKLTKEEYKDLFTAGLKQQKVIPGLEGGFIVIGAHTSKMTVAEMAELIELMTAFGAQHNVRWSAPEGEE